MDSSVSGRTLGKKVLRDYRNYIHPEKELSHGITVVAEDTAMFVNVFSSIAETDHTEREPIVVLASIRADRKRTLCQVDPDRCNFTLFYGAITLLLGYVERILDALHQVHSFERGSPSRVSAHANVYRLFAWALPLKRIFADRQECDLGSAKPPPQRFRA